MVEFVVIVMVMPLLRAVTLVFVIASIPLEVAPFRIVPETVPGLKGLIGVTPEVTPRPLGPLRMGAPVVVTEFDRAIEDAAVGDVEFMTTLNVYAVPFLSPVTKHLVVEVTHVVPPGSAVTVYLTPVNWDALEGATNVTRASESPANATTSTGAPAEDAVPVVTVSGIVAVADCPVLVTDTVTRNVPVVVGVPETTPPLEHVRSAGRPEHVHVLGPVPLALSVAL
jgi:hypothetical protein